MHQCGKPHPPERSVGQWLPGQQREVPLPKPPDGPPLRPEPRGEEPPLLGLRD